MFKNELINNTHIPLYVYYFRILYKHNLKFTYLDYTQRAGRLFHFCLMLKFLCTILYSSTRFRDEKLARIKNQQKRWNSRTKIFIT